MSITTNDEVKGFFILMFGVFLAFWELYFPEWLKLTIMMFCLFYGLIVIIKYRLKHNEKKR